MNSELTMTKVQLPEADSYTVPMLQHLTKSLGVNRDILATDDQIQNACQNLPNLLSNIPPEKRDEGIVRMCVAVASGLFDSAINYVWNAAIIELREKVRRFGIHIIPEIIDKKFDEQKLLDLQDSELLSLCLNLNLITETGYLMLNQCREIRNNFSAAHPAVGPLDDFEFINFLNRCSRYALSENTDTTAIDIKELIATISEGNFTDEQLDLWVDRIDRTFDAQRETILKMLHGIYCNPNKEEHARVTAIELCDQFAEKLSSSIISELINQHHMYLAKGKRKRTKFSRIFFERLGLIRYLSESERHAIISSACKQLIRVHYAVDNFYNERPFAERLADLSINHEMPETVRIEFVKSVVTCLVGSQYGTARDAEVYYKRMIAGFSPKEIEIMLSLPDQDTEVKFRIDHFNRCKAKFTEIVRLLKAKSIPAELKSTYKKWIRQ